MWKQSREGCVQQWMSVGWLLIMMVLKRAISIALKSHCNVTVTERFHELSGHLQLLAHLVQACRSTIQGSPREGEHKKFWKSANFLQLHIGYTTFWSTFFQQPVFLCVFVCFIHSHHRNEKKLRNSLFVIRNFQNVTKSKKP